jgi:hypothetical protein
MAKKLHELLAVEPDLKNKFNLIADETMVTFNKKADHFLGSLRTLTMVDVDRKHEEAAGEVRKEFVTTVDEKLRYTWESIVPYFDSLLMKEKTNQSAGADLVVDGEVLAKDVPATFLLGMEDRLKLVRAVYAAIPTQQPGIAWAPDPNERPGVYKAVHPEHAQKTEKDFQFKVLVPANDKHPAQLEKWDATKVAGVYTTEKWTSMWTPAEKSLRLGRIDELITAVKECRMRANGIDVVKLDIGEKFRQFIHRP